MDTALRAIADPHRREILRLVRDEERTAGDIANQFAVTRPAISQHLRVLIDAELVHVRRDGNRRYYRARPETINSVIRFLDRFWDDRLEKLRLAAEAAERAKRTANSNVPMSDRTDGEEES